MKVRASNTKPLPPSAATAMDIRAPITSHWLAVESALSAEAFAWRENGIAVSLEGGKGDARKGDWLGSIAACACDHQPFPITWMRMSNPDARRFERGSTTSAGSASNSLSDLSSSSFERKAHRNHGGCRRDVR